MRKQSYTKQQIVFSSFGYFLFTLFLLLILSTPLACSSRVTKVDDSALQQQEEKPYSQFLEQQKAKLSLQQDKRQVKENSETNFVLPYQASKTLEYPQYNVLPKYRSEQSLGVKYFTSTERQAFKVSTKDGRLINSNQKLLDPELDDPKNINRSGKAIFVISVDGLVWICFDQKYGYIHHSSLLAAAPILAGGELVVEEGQLLSISNSSGHYKPPSESLTVALQIFQKIGVNLSQTQLFEVSPTGVLVQKNQTAEMNSIKSKAKKDIE